MFSLPPLRVEGYTGYSTNNWTHKKKTTNKQQMELYNTFADAADSILDSQNLVTDWSAENWRELSVFIDQEIASQNSTSGDRVGLTVLQDVKDHVQHRLDLLMFEENILKGLAVLPYSIVESSSFEESFPNFDANTFKLSNTGIFGIIKRLFQDNSPILNEIIHQNGLTIGINKITSLETLNVDSILSDFKNELKLLDLKKELENQSLTYSSINSALSTANDSLNRFSKFITFNNYTLQNLTYAATCFSGIFIYKNLLKTYISIKHPINLNNNSQFSYDETLKILNKRGQIVKRFNILAIPLIIAYACAAQKLEAHLLINIVSDPNLVLQSSVLMFNQYKNKLNKNKQLKQSVNNKNNNNLPDWKFYTLLFCLTFLVQVLASNEWNLQVTEVKWVTYIGLLLIIFWYTYNFAKTFLILFLNMTKRLDKEQNNIEINNVKLKEILIDLLFLFGSLLMFVLICYLLNII